MSNSMYLYLRASLWEKGGYFTAKRVEKPQGNWKHLAFVYYVIADDSRRLTLFDLFVDGEFALRDSKKEPEDTDYGDGRIVLGRPYSQVDDFYTSMTVDELVFYNGFTSHGTIKTLYETGGQYIV